LAACARAVRRGPRLLTTLVALPGAVKVHFDGQPMGQAGGIALPVEPASKGDVGWGHHRVTRNNAVRVATGAQCVILLTRQVR